MDKEQSSKQGEDVYIFINGYRADVEAIEKLFKSVERGEESVSSVKRTEHGISIYTTEFLKA